MKNKIKKLVSVFFFLSIIEKFQSLKKYFKYFKIGKFFKNKKY